MLSENKIFKAPDSHIEEKFLLWCSLIDESAVEDKTKVAFKELLEKFKNWSSHYKSIQDAIYFTSHGLVDAYRADKDQMEAHALFSNINSDIWSLLKTDSK
ncbi:MAG: hypothetical protein WCV69_00860 [Patescibacteria group bacterium]|jgi:hypothetical protein